jgi:hypothetical protein
MRTYVQGELGIGNWELGIGTILEVAAHSEQCFAILDFRFEYVKFAKLVERE